MTIEQLETKISNAVRQRNALASILRRSQFKMNMASMKEAEAQIERFNTRIEKLEMEQAA